MKKKQKKGIDWNKLDKSLKACAKNKKDTFAAWARRHSTKKVPISPDTARKHANRKGWKKLAVLALACLLTMTSGIATVRAGEVEPQPFWGLLDGVSTSVLTDMRADMLEVRVTKTLDDFWSVGALGTYFADNSDDPAKDWGIGGFVKLTVDPDAKFPVANWLPWLGEKLQLPESLDADAYIIGKGEVLPYDDDIDLMLGVGPGFAMGPFIVEYLFNLVESGDSDSPALSSKPVLWFGMTPIRF